MTETDRQLLDSFENHTLSLDHWSQRSHVSIAYLYLREHGFDDGLERMRRGVKTFNAAKGIDESPTSGYNETTTVAFMRIIDAILGAYEDTFPTRSSAEFCDTHSQLMDKHILRLFYSPEQRMHPDAKTSFVEPDLAPLPIRSRARQSEAAAPMTKDHTIIPFNNARHRAQVIELWGAVFGYETPRNDPSLAIDKKMARADGLFFVATADKVIGTVMAGYDGHRGWIYSLAVANGHRRRHLGSDLMAHAESALTKLGCVKINLQILEDNEEVEAFYHKLGYTTEPRISMGKCIAENLSSAE